MINCQKKTKPIYILVEVGQREYNSRLQLARKLSSLGYIIIFGQKSNILDFISIGILPHGILFDKCAQISSTKKGRNIIKNGSILTVLDEEGIHTFKDQVAHRSGNFNFIDTIFFNNLFHKILWFKLFKNSPNQPNRKILSGNPRINKIDISEANKNYESNLWNANKKKSLTIILIGNFRTEINNPFIDEDLEAKETILRFMSKVRKISWINAIYRPHPSENEIISNYAKSKGIKVISGGDIKDAVKGCDVIVTHRCTSNIEFALSGKVLLSYYSGKNKNNFTRQASLRFEKVSTLIKHLENILNDISKIDIKRMNRERARLYKWFSAPDDSMNTIVKIIKEISHKDAKKTNFIFLGIRVWVSNFLSAFANQLLYSRIYEYSKYRTGDETNNLFSLIKKNTFIKLIK